MMDYIEWLADYAIDKELIEKEDRMYIVNTLLDVFDMDEPDEETHDLSGIKLAEVLDRMCDYAVMKGIIEQDSVVYRDLFDTKVMGIVTPRPGEVIRKFKELYKESPVKATDYFYKLCLDSNYIRRDRISKDMRWKTQTEDGELDITINLSKPEKDPKAIAAAKLMKQSGYPKCQLCAENEGYAGRVNHPARQNLRAIPLTINQEDWGFQYSPYVYYNEHCIVFNKKHTPMKIDRACFTKLFDFVKQFPHYFLGSNADLPIVGGSILSHDHFQGGNYTFAMAKAGVETPVSFKGYDDVKAGIVKWPMSVIRLASEDSSRIIDLACSILNAWRKYTDESVFIYAETNGEPHNTITPIARKNGNMFELDLVLRNNITTEEHPLGVFHPHSELHHIKKENIGLIEVMGLAVLPARLKEELAEVRKCLVENTDAKLSQLTEKHAEWIDMIREKYGNISDENADKILEDEVGFVFAQVLEHAGVFKRNQNGKEAFLRFVEFVNSTLN